MPFPKPKTPLAKNSLDSVDLFFYRTLYRDEMLVRENGSEIPTIIDIWYKKHLYGKINSRGDFIMPKQNLVSFLTSKNDETHFALNFVARAYNEMVSAIDNEKIQGNIPPSSPLNNFTVVNGWTSVYDKYHEHLKGLYGKLTNYIYDRSIGKRIKNFGDFTREFFVFFDTMISVSKPLTLSGFVMGRDLSNRASGLMIDIGDKSYSSDRQKFTHYITDPLFTKYEYFATKYGFLIDKNIPWRLVANLNSCFMRDKMAEEGVFYASGGLRAGLVHSAINPNINKMEVISNPQVAEAIQTAWANIFDIYYFKTYEFDIKYLKSYMELMYDSYIKESPTFEIYKDIPSGAKIKTKEKRKPLDYNNMSGYNIKNFWLDKYFAIRISETEADFSQAEFNYIMFNCKKVYKIYGEYKAYKFLNDKLKKRHKHLYNSITNRYGPPRCVDLALQFQERQKQAKNSGPM